MSKVVVVTGGSSGIGLETVKLFKKQGHTVIVIANNVETNEKKLVYNCNVANVKQVESVFNAIYSKFARINILVNSAGYGISGASELINANKVQGLYDVNIQGTINCSKQALKHMQKGDKIINLGSAMAFFPLPFRSYYASSKAAVVTLSYGMRMELKNFGVDVCVICPGDVKTNFTKNRVKDFNTNEKYGTRVEKAAGELDGQEHKRMHPIKVAKVIVSQGNKKRSKHLKIVGTKYKVLYVLQKLFPTSWVLNIIEKNFSGY